MLVGSTGTDRLRRAFASNCDSVSVLCIIKSSSSTVHSSCEEEEDGNMGRVVGVRTGDASVVRYSSFCFDDILPNLIPSALL